MPRGKKATESQTKEQSTPQIEQPYQYEFSSDEFIEQFANRLSNNLSRLNSFYNPYYANSLMKDINNSPTKPNNQQLKKWIENPQYFEKELRDVSSYLESSVMQYFRSVAHFASILSFKYQLIPEYAPPEGRGKRKTYDNCKARSNEWLRKFRPVEQFQNVMFHTMLDGGAYYYVREDDNYIELQEMPRDYCKITGRVPALGYTYAFNLVYFAKYTNELAWYAPEFQFWWEDIIKEYKDYLSINVWKPMPPEKSIIFKFQDYNATMRPPLSGVFKDAVEIQDYKDILKSKIELDTWKIIMMEIPKDKDGKPIVDARTAADFNAMVQAQLPMGVKSATTLMKSEAINFEQAQSQNNIIGMGEQNFWGSVGVAGNQFGGETNSGNALKYSNLADYNFVKHMYKQFERFVNFHLKQLKGEYSFRVKFSGCSYFDEEEKKQSLSFAQSGGAPEFMYAMHGYEPYEVESMLADSFTSDIRKYTVPIQTAATMSSKDGGAPSKLNSEMTDEGITSRDTI